MLTLYGILDADEREEYLELARRAGSAGWWQQYSDVTPSWLETILGLEDAARFIRGRGVAEDVAIVEEHDSASGDRECTRDGARDVLEGRIEITVPVDALQLGDDWLE